MADAQSVLVVIDMQNDFISGSLGTPEAQAILDGVVEKVEGFPGRVLYTLDTHGDDYLETQEGRNLPVEHCLRGTDGWQVPRKLADALARKNARAYEKPTFGSVELARDLFARGAQGVGAQRHRALACLGKPAKDALTGICRIPLLDLLCQKCRQAAFAHVLSLGCALPLAW